ncbi:MAG: RNA polymerase sigma factor [Pseudomonadota bacterium]
MAPSTEKDIQGNKQHLLKRHVAGDTNAFPQLVGLFRARVYSYLSRCGINAQTRDDIFQEVFIKIHIAAATYNSDLPLDPWVFTIVANTVRTHYRKERVREMVKEDQYVQEHEALDNTQQDILEAAQTARWLNKAIQTLPFQQRETLALCSLENMSHSEAATALNIPVNTVKTNLRRARMSLAKLLTRRMAIEHSEVI